MNESFLNRFEYITLAYAEKPFFTMVEQERTYTFKQFYSDVKAISFYLLREYSDVPVIAITGKNSYEFAVFATAVIVSGKVLFPLNFNENTLQLKKLLSMIEQKYVLFTNVEVPFSFSMPMSLQTPAPIDFKLPGPGLSEDIVYMATSASTGDSKIVRQRENALLSNVDDLILHHDLKPGKKIATPLPLFHVNALHFSFFCSLFSGGEIYLLESFNPQAIFKAIEKEKIHIVSLIPILLNNLISNAESLSSRDISSLEYFVSAAAPLSTSIVDNIKKYFGKRILQGYGLSEAINFSCVIPRNLTEELYNECMIKEKYPSIGIPLKHTKISILNEKESECSEGETGEILLEGIQVMPGYLNSENGLGFYKGKLRTGDLGYFKTFNGLKFYFIAGRKKEIAKVAGESVSLRELDEQIKSVFELPNDFMCTYFENTYRGEELALICSIKKGEDCERLVDQLKKAFLDFHQIRTPKVILFIVDKALRTASGKAKRFQFNSALVEFKDKRFLNQLIIKTI